MDLRTRTPGARALLPVTRSRASGQLEALLSSPVLGVRLITALQVLQDNPREGWEDGTPPPHRDFKLVACKNSAPALGTWSTWSAVSNLTPRTGELRSAPSWPDARDRVAGKRALAQGVRVRRAITRVSEG